MGKCDWHVHNNEQLIECCDYFLCDSYDELLVGAPMYSSLNPLVVERGRLYVFFNAGVCRVCMFLM